MNEKRSTYRREQRRNKHRRLLHDVRAAFKDDHSTTDMQAPPLDVNRDFQGHQDEQEPLSRQEAPSLSESRLANDQEKGLRIKRRLNHAIIVVVFLIVLVLIALFHL